MTKSYIYGRVETPKPKKVKQKKSHIPDDVINQDEVEYNQLQNKIIQDKIHETYVKAHETEKVIPYINNGRMITQELWSFISQRAISTLRELPIYLNFYVMSDMAT